MINPSFGCELLERYGSPLYVYDLEEAERRAKALFELLPKRAKLLRDAGRVGLHRLLRTHWTGIQAKALNAEQGLGFSSTVLEMLPTLFSGLSLPATTK